MKAGLWFVVFVNAGLCVLIGRNAFTEALVVIALVAFVLASLMELTGGRR